MKLDQTKKSKNIEDRSRDTSAAAFKSNPFKNPALMRVNEQRRKEYQSFAKDAMKKTRANKQSPFHSMLKGMDKPNPLTPKQKLHNKIPIPTPKPAEKDRTNPKIFND